MKKVKILTIVLAVILITAVAVFGIYVPYQNRMVNKVKNYSYAMDLEGVRAIRLRVDDETKTVIKDSDGNEVEDSDDLTDEQIAENGYTKEEVPYNSEDVKNKENYNKSKKIIEKRLKKLSVDNYTIKLDEETGDIVIEFSEKDSETRDNILRSLVQPGKFEIVDTETGEVLMDNNDIKLANVLYGSDTSSSATTQVGTVVYLNIEFTREGAKKLEDISSKYVKVEETTEKTEEAEETAEDAEESSEKADNEEKTITMKIDDEEVISTSFEEPMNTGKIQLSIGSSSTDRETIQEYADQALSRAIILDTGNMPIQYEVSESQYVLSDITRDNLQIVKYIIAAILAIALVILVIRYKAYGFLGAVAYVGLIALLLLIIRYANVILSIEGIFGIVVIMILNYIFTNKLLSKIKTEKEIDNETIKSAVKETYKEFSIKIIPILIAVITFCFIKWAPISSFGMVMFWGIALILIYNIAITNNILKIKASK